jgi:peroxiredoxin
MKRIIFLILCLFGLTPCFSQTKNLSDIYLIHISTGDTINKILENQNGTLIVLNFSIFCGPCMNELKALSAVYNDWQKKYNVKIVAVSYDYNGKYKNQTIRFVKAHTFTFELYDDLNMDVSNYFYALESSDKTGFDIYNGKPRIMNPQTFIIDKNGKLIYQKKGYMPGSEKTIEVLLDSIK